MVFVLAFWSPQFRKSAASRQCSLASADSSANVTHFAFCAPQVIELPADREEEKKAAEAAVAKTRQQAEARGQGEHQQSGPVPVKPEPLSQGSSVIVKVEQ